jgi:DNA-binding NarL/FixJ family response regulator
MNNITVNAGSLRLLLMPLMRRKLFQVSWINGFHRRNTAKYIQHSAGMDKIETKEHPDLTAREQKIFTMLLGGKAPKEIAYALKISYSTVNFHTANLYRKLKIHSRAELFIKYKE